MFVTPPDGFVPEYINDTMAAVKSEDNCFHVSNKNNKFTYKQNKPT